MSKQVKFRRGTTAEHATFTGALGEVTVDTTKNVTIVHNASTAGGIPSAREDRPRGWTKTEIFTTVGQNISIWTTSGKTDLKRVRVTCYGGGGGGASSGSSGIYAGGGSGGISTLVIEASSLTSNVSISVGAGGGAGSSGTQSSFASYITAAGGSPGSGNTAGGSGGTGGTNHIVLGGQGGDAGDNINVGNYYAGGFPFYDGYGGFAGYYSVYGATATGTSTGGRGGGIGGGAAGSSAIGITGGGGGAGGSGTQGCVIVEEIYGLV